MNDVGTNSAPNDEAERAALDEAWSALGQLLEVAFPAFDEGLLVDRVCQRLERRRTARRLLAGGLALAAVLLLAIGLGWPRLAHERGVVVAKQRPDFTWHDDLEDEISQARSEMIAAEAELYASFEPARWLQDEIDDLQWEIEASDL